MKTVSPAQAVLDESSKHERWTIRRLGISVVALLLSVIWLVFSFCGIGMPASLDVGDWFQRSGAAVTVLCVFNQQVLASIPVYLLPQNGLFSDGSRIPAWIKFRKYLPYLAHVNFAVMLFATITWGYGDIIHAFVVSLCRS